MAEPWSLSLAEAAIQIRDRQLSPVDLARSLLDRIEELDLHLHAWVTIDHESVIASAQAAERELGETGPRSPLHGLPVALKDIFYTAGMKTTACSPLYAEFVPTYDATVVSRLKESRAIILGKAVTTEFATADPSPTVNPWNPAHTPGGSSSGSSVAVASRMCAAALGSQTGGSTCRPAAYNGIVGLKPTYGRLSRHGVIPVSWSLDTVGILVRTVEDAAIMLGAMAGHDPSDPGSADQPVLDYQSAVRQADSPPRIRLLRQFFLDQCDSETRSHTEDVAHRLGSAGAQVDEAPLPASFNTCFGAHRVVMAVECAAFHEELHRQYPDQYSPGLRSTIEAGLIVPGVHYIQSQRMRRAFRRDMEAMVASGEILATPTTPAPAPRDLTTTGDPIFQSPWTSCGLPTVTIPTGLSHAGLPMGIQLVGSPFREDLLLAAARWCEQALEVTLTPPERS